MVGVAEELAVLLCMNLPSLSAAAAAHIFPVSRADRRIREKQRLGRRRRRRDREGWRRIAAKRAAPLPGDAWPIFPLRGTFRPVSGRRSGFD